MHLLSPFSPRWTPKILVVKLLSTLASVRSRLQGRSSYRSIPSPKPKSVSVLEMPDVPDKCIVPLDASSSSVLPSGLSHTTAITPTVASGARETTFAGVRARGKGWKSQRGAFTVPLQTHHPAGDYSNSVALVRNCRSLQKSFSNGAKVPGRPSRTAGNDRIYGQSLERFRDARTKEWVCSMMTEVPLLHPVVEEVTSGDYVQGFRLDQWVSSSSIVATEQ